MIIFKNRNIHTGIRTLYCIDQPLCLDAGILKFILPPGHVIPYPQKWDIERHQLAPNPEPIISKFFHGKPFLICNDPYSFAWIWDAKSQNRPPLCIINFQRTMAATTIADSGEK